MLQSSFPHMLRGGGAQNSQVVGPIAGEHDKRREWIFGRRTTSTSGERFTLPAPAAGLLVA